MPQGPAVQRVPQQENKAFRLYDMFYLQHIR